MGRLAGLRACRWDHSWNRYLPKYLLRIHGNHRCDCGRRERQAGKWKINFSVYSWLAGRLDCSWQESNNRIFNDLSVTAARQETGCQLPPATPVITSTNSPNYRRAFGKLSGKLVACCNYLRRCRPALQRSHVSTLHIAAAAESKNLRKCGSTAEQFCNSPDNSVVML